MATGRDDLLSELGRDALEDYRASRARLELVRAAWQADGSRALSKGSTDQTICHPLLSELRVLEAHVERLRGAARVGTNWWRPDAEPVKLRSATR
jgi:hypothetical protein